jgi:predicted MFS family arabinose efflux permease
MPQPAPAPARTPPGGRWQAWATLDPRVWTMAVARAVNTMGMSLVMSFLAVYVVEDRGYPASIYGLIALVANVGQSMSNAWAGDLSDRIGRRPLITSSLLLRAAVIAVLGVQVLLHAPLWTLALNVIASSALRGCFEPVAYALVSDVVTADERIAAFGLQRMGTNLGWAIGPAAGGLLALVIPYGAVFFFAAGGLVLAALTTTRIADPRPHGIRLATHERAVGLRDAFAEALERPVMVALLAGTFLFSLVHTQLFSTFAVYTTDRVGLSKGDLGLLYMVNGAAVLLLQLPALAAIRRFGVEAALVAASLVFALGFLLVGAAGGFAGLVAAIAVITVGEVLFAPAHQTAIAETGDTRRLGRAFGVVGFTQMLGVAFAPLVGGVLFDATLGRPLVMWSAIAGLAVALTVSFAAFRRLRHRPQP